MSLHHTSNFFNFSASPLRGEVIKSIYIVFNWHNTSLEEHLGLMNVGIFVQRFRFRVRLPGSFKLDSSSFVLKRDKIRAVVFLFLKKFLTLSVQGISQGPRKSNKNYTNFKVLRTVRMVLERLNINLNKNFN